MFRKIFGTVLAAACAATVLAAPAYAVGSPTLMTAVSGYNSTPARSAVAHCPASAPYVYGGAGRITDGTSGVVLTDVIPDAGLTSVTAWGHENGAYAGNWSVTAYAICGAWTTGLQRVAATAPASAATDKTAVATCPAGTKVYGTGFQLTGATGQVLPTMVAPDPALATVTVAATDTPGFTGSWSLTGYAVCAQPATTMTLIVTAGSTTIGTPPRTVNGTACPAGTRMHGIGAAVTNGGSVMVLTGLTPDSGLTSGFILIDGWWWYFTAGSGTVYTICSS